MDTIGEAFCNDTIDGGEGVWLNETGWSYGKNSQYGELKAWCTTRSASRAAYRLLSGRAESPKVEPGNDAEHQRHRRRHELCLHEGIGLPGCLLCDPRPKAEEP